MVSWKGGLDKDHWEGSKLEESLRRCGLGLEVGLEIRVEKNI